MKKRQSTFLNSINKKADFFLDYLAKNKNKVFFFAVFSILLLLTSKIPYINLFFNKDVVSFILIILLFWLFSIRIKGILYISLGITILAMIFQIFGKYEDAEILGSFLYGILFYSSLLLIFDKNVD